MLDSKRLGVRYVVYLFLVLITVVAVCAWAVVSYHWIFGHTYTLPGNAPTGLTTERKGEVYWALFVITVMRILLLTACTGRSANTFNRLFRYVLALVAFFAVLAEIAALVIFIIERNACNNAPDDDPSGRFNMCNDYRWCCVYATQNMTEVCSPSNTTVIEPSCPILLQPCDPPVFEEDLSSNWVFDFTFASTVIFMVIASLHLVVSGWMGNGSESADYAGDAYGDGTYFNDNGYDLEGSINGEVKSNDESDLHLNVKRTVKNVKTK